MFNRDEVSWHELNPVSEDMLKEYKDSYSAKYLNRVYYPDFKLRVRERDKPHLSLAAIAFKRRIKHKYGKVWIF